MNFSAKVKKFIEQHLLDEQQPVNDDRLSNYFYLDIMKCIAIIFVIAYHTGALNNNIIEDPGINTYINYFISTLVSSCVPIFFFVNGFLLLNKPIKLNKLVHKVFNTLFIYLFWRYATFPIVYGINGIPFDSKSIWADFMQLKAGYTNHLWFLTALIGIYILYPIIKQTFDTNFSFFKYFLIGVFLMSFGTRLLGQISDIINYNFRGELDWGITKFLNSFNKFSSTYGFGLVYFMIGGLFFKFKNYRIKKSVVLIVLVISMLISLSYGIMMSNASNEIYDVVWSGYDVIPTILITCSLLFLFNTIKYNNGIFHKIIMVIGRNSLGIYLLHNIVILTTKGPFMALWGQSNFLIRYTYVFVVLFLSLIINIILKKIPILNNVITIQSKKTPNLA